MYFDHVFTKFLIINRTLFVADTWIKLLLELLWTRQNSEFQNYMVEEYIPHGPAGCPNLMLHNFTWDCENLTDTQRTKVCTKVQGHEICCGQKNSTGFLFEEWYELGHIAVVWATCGRIDICVAKNIFAY